MTEDETLPRIDLSQMRSHWKEEMNGENWADQLKVSGKLPTYPSPKPPFGPKWEVSVNVDLGKG